MVTPLLSVPAICVFSSDQKRASFSPSVVSKGIPILRFLRSLLIWSLRGLPTLFLCACPPSWLLHVSTFDLFLAFNCCYRMCLQTCTGSPWFRIWTCVSHGSISQNHNPLYIGVSVPLAHIYIYIYIYIWDFSCFSLLFGWNFFAALAWCWETYSYSCLPLW